MFKKRSTTGSFKDRFTEEEWYLVMSVPILFFGTTAGADGTIDEAEAGELQRTMQTGAIGYKDPLHREVASQFFSTPVTLEELLAKASAAGPEAIRKVLRKRLSKDEYQGYLSSVWISAIGVAHVSGEVSEPESKALTALAAFFGIDVAGIGSRFCALDEREGDSFAGHSRRGFSKARVRVEPAQAPPGREEPPTPPEPTVRVAHEPASVIPSTSRGEWERVEAVSRDPVDLTVFAPPEAAPSDDILVQVFAHEIKKAAEAGDIAHEADRTSRRAGSLGTELEVGSVLTLELALPGLLVDEPSQDLTWTRRTVRVTFGVSVPGDASLRSVVGKVSVSQASVPIGKIHFALEIVDGASRGRRGLHRTGDPRRYQRAFISYASENRSEVLRRVQMLPRVGVGYFQDVLNLDPADRWKRRIYEAMDDCDVLFLFWSTAASESRWVAREWRYGLERKGDEFIQPVVIEGPPFPPPPPELAHLHFADSIQYFIAAS